MEQMRLSHQKRKCIFEEYSAKKRTTVDTLKRNIMQKECVVTATTSTDAIKSHGIVLTINSTLMGCAKIVISTATIANAEKARRWIEKKENYRVN